MPETDRQQLWLFDEAETRQQAESSHPSAEEEHVPVRSHTRRKRGRKPLPPELPRVETVHDIPEEQKVCGCGAELTRIGEEVWREAGRIIPAQVRVRRHIRCEVRLPDLRGLRR